MVTTPAPDDDVEKILTRVMSQQSPMMKQARTQGLQAAQTAGLGQSTKGIEAAQAAAYQAAFPIASQQAQQGFQKGMQREEFGHQRGMQGAQFGHETGMQQAGFGQQTKMQTAEFGQQSKLQGAQFGHETGMQGRQFGHEAGMQTRGFQHAASQADLDRFQQEKMANLTGYLDRLKMHEEFSVTLPHEANMRAQDRQMQERLAAMEINAADKERALSAMTQFNSAFTSAYAQIAQNENIPADARAYFLDRMNVVRDHNQNLTTTLYGYVVPW